MGPRLRFLALARLAAAALLCGGCDSRSLEKLQAKVVVEDARVVVEVGPAKEPAAPAPAAVATTEAIEPRLVDTSGPPRLMFSERRYAGGRPLPWWSERLARLRAQGPEDLYRLTVTRARLCGLAVEERPGGEVAVADAPSPPEARP